MPETPEPVSSPYDALLIFDLGGPEKPEEVMPFLENVTRGRGIPPERLREVAEHYHHLGGRSPINDQVRALIAALGPELARQGVNLPIYWGNRNWHPLLETTVRRMTSEGVRHALAIVLAAYSSYSSCRQYREDIVRAQQAVGPNAPSVDKVRVFYNHPLFIEATADRLRSAIERLPNGPFHVAFTAHSIPMEMARTSRYVEQLTETARLVAEASGVSLDRWQLVYQSRSGRPQDPWLEPDILDHLRDLAARGVRQVVISPIGFLSDHVEVLYDLDDEARREADALGITLQRAATVGTHPQFISMLAELVRERLGTAPERRAIGAFGSDHDACPIDCCPATARPAR